MSDSFTPHHSANLRMHPAFVHECIRMGMPPAFVRTYVIAGIRCVVNDGTLWHTSIPKLCYLYSCITKLYSCITKLYSCIIKQTGAPMRFREKSSGRTGQLGGNPRI